MKVAHSQRLQALTDIMVPFVAKMIKLKNFQADIKRIALQPKLVSCRPCPLERVEKKEERL